MGQDTDLDKGILDQLAEPLTHLVRNAVDHGIETAGTSVAAGKSPQGFVKLNGLSPGQPRSDRDQRRRPRHGCRQRSPQRQSKKAPSRARSRAHERSAEAGTRFSNQASAPPIAVTEVSGRGVGMDVVRNVDHTLKGTVQIISTPGKARLSG